MTPKTSSSQLRLTDPIPGTPGMQKLLRENGLETMGQLRATTWAQLHISGLGPKNRMGLLHLLADNGLSLKDGPVSELFLPERGRVALLEVLTVDDLGPMTTQGILFGRTGDNALVEDDLWRGQSGRRVTSLVSAAEEAFDQGRGIVEGRGARTLYPGF